MTDSFLNREIPREPNYGIPYAIYLVLRRQPWKAMASTTRRTIKRMFLVLSGQHGKNSVPPTRALPLKGDR